MTEVIGTRDLIRFAFFAIIMTTSPAILSSPADAANQCPAGQVHIGPTSCMPSGGVDCGNGRYCNSGQYCSSPRGKCIENGDIDCHDGHACKAGSICVPGGCADPRAPARSNSSGSGCGSDVTGTGSTAQRRTDCGPSRQQVIQQRTQRQGIRRVLGGGGQQQTTNYSYSYGYTPASLPPVYRDDPQVIYEKVKQKCGSTPTADCAAGVVNLDAMRNDLRRRLSEKAFRARIEAMNGPIEASVPEGAAPAPAGQAGGPVVTSSSPAWSPDEQTLFCHVVLEKIQSGDLGFSRDEQIPAECRRDQEIIDALKKAKAEHPFVTFSGPDTENEITRLLKPAVFGDDALEKQMPPEPDSK